MIPSAITLEGHWVSPRSEPIHNADGSTIYGVREFVFSGDHWSLYFTAYGDAEASYPLFTLRAEGVYHIGQLFATVPGAHEVDFHFNNRYLTAQAEPFVELLNSATSNEAWIIGIERDVSATGALFIPSLQQAAVEYDLVALRDGALYLGDRSGDLSKTRATVLGSYGLTRIS